ncbi:MAG: two-component system cell cycle sensor histidine kinase/response regulator CckA [Pseudoalteromonas tetraodonis]|jgi:two-component system cell cycle sensor histidine kinase/response regulator CckA
MKPTRILVVEDEGVIGRDVQNTLVQLGYVVPDVARTGEEALELVARIEPDLVLMDIRLSGEMDGIETAARIKTDYRAPVIFLTALADRETIARAKATEPYGYLLKPFNDRELQSTVEMAVSRSRAQKRLEASEERFANTLRSLADGVIATDLVGNVTFLNPLAEAITGWASEEAVGRPLQEIFRITRPSGEEAPPMEMREGDGEPRPVLLQSRSGVKIAIEDNSAPLKNDDGSLAGLVVVFRKRVLPEGAPGARATSESNAPLVGLIEGIADPLLAVGADWVITFANPQAAGLFEKARDEIVGRVLWDEFPASIRTEYYGELYEALSKQERRTIEMEIKERGLWFGAEIYPFGDGLLILLRDISARKEDEQRHRRLEKLESLGLLARGFAHDFNNLLTVLLGNISLAQMKLPEVNEASEELASANKAAVQAQGRVHQLLTFAKGGVPIRQKQALGPVLDEFLATHDRQKKIGYVLKVADRLPQVQVDAGQLKRLIDNLVTNAERAMYSGGDIEISGESLPANSAQRANLPDGLDLDDGVDYVLLQVKDTGSGIASEHLDKVFEPYFTTRRRENATGIGLTVCESIARAHEGGIAVEASEGEGTTVSVTIPVAAQGKEEVAAKTEMPAVDAKARILILEDEPLVRQIMVRSLQSSGHELVETADGAETVARYLEAMEAGRAFDLVITDLSIPNGMGGIKAIEEIRQSDPDVLAIVSSGYADEPAMANPEQFGYAAVLPKPYQPNDLVGLVDLVLNGR